MRRYVFHTLAFALIGGAVWTVVADEHLWWGVVFCIAALACGLAGSTDDDYLL